jgi:outer membrane protein assembly factor BamA
MVPASMLRAGVLGYLLLMLAGEGSAQIEQPPQAVRLPARVSQVVVRGNEKTRSSTVRTISGIGVNDRLTNDQLSDARRRLLASGLFSELTVIAEPAGGGAVRVVIILREKISWVIAPTFSFSSSNVGGGLIYAENNLFGLNKKFVAFAQLTSADSGVFLGFQDSNLFNWYPLSLTLEAIYRLDRVDEYSPLDATAGDPEVQRRTRVQSFGGGAGFIINWFDTVKTAIRYRYLKVGNFDPRETDLGPAFDPGPRRTDANLRLSAGYDTLRDLAYIQDGTVLELGYERSSPSWGSDFRYREVGLTFRRGQRLFGEHNLRLRATAHVQVDPPFHAELTAGGNNLRGYLYRQFRGDTRVAATAEYHFPLFTVGPLVFRGLVFDDAAVIFFRNLPADLVLRDDQGRLIRRYLPTQSSGLTGDGWGDGLGLGLRLYLKNVVVPLLGVDYGYAATSGAWRFYLVIGLT